jgi:hypothetical protein
MEYNILIKKEDLTHRIDLLTHYHAECEKRKDINADVGETSFDDDELLETFLTKAANELIAEQAGRLNISFKSNRNYIDITFVANNDKGEHLTPILKQAITDYLVNEIMTQWLLIRYPAWSQTYIAMRSELHSQVKELFAAFSNKKIRRRPTNLAGI